MHPSPGIDPFEPAVQGGSWYAVQTRSRHEKLSSNLIALKGIETYLPLRRFKRKWTDRVKFIETPLFHGYFFVRIPQAAMDSVRYTKGVVRLVGHPVPQSVPEAQIESLRLFETHEILVDPYPDLQPGGLVKVTQGPLKGCRGYLVQKKSTCRLLLALDVLRQAVSVEIDIADITPDN